MKYKQITFNVILACDMLLKVFIQCYILDHVAVEDTLTAFQILLLISEITTYSNCGYLFTHTSVSSV